MKKIDPHAKDLKAAIREKYDAYSPRYDLMLGVLEVIGMRDLRRRLLRNAGGEVLEVAVGTGMNLPYYPQGCRLTAIDFSPGMISCAEKKVARNGMEVEFRVMDAEHLDFPDASFDTVVSTLATSIFPDPVRALREMARVVRPEGRILLLEVGYSRYPWLRDLQDLRVERQFQWLGSRWNREPVEQAQQAGLILEEHRCRFFGAIHAMILRRGDDLTLEKGGRPAGAAAPV